MHFSHKADIRQGLGVCNIGGEMFFQKSDLTQTEGNEVNEEELPQVHLNVTSWQRAEPFAEGGLDKNSSFCVVPQLP